MSCLHKSNSITRNRSDVFSSPMKELPGVCRLQCEWHISVQSIVGQHECHLHKCVWRHVAFLYESFAEICHMSDMKIGLLRQFCKLCLGLRPNMSTCCAPPVFLVHHVTSSIPFASSDVIFHLSFTGVLLSAWQLAELAKSRGWSLKFAMFS